MFAPRCEGVYVEVNTASGGAEVCAAPGIGTNGAFSCATSGANFAYTTDGSDPRYSPTVRYGTAADTTASGTTVKVYAYRAQAFPSVVTEKTF